MEEVLKFKYEKGGKNVYPAHWMVSHWGFTENEEKEAALAHQLAVVAENNGLTSNDLGHLFPAILRMLKSDIQWAK